LVAQTVHVTGLFGVPPDAVAVTGNVTVTGQTKSGSVTVAPSLTSGSRPPTSTINFPVGDTRGNGVTVAIGPGGGLDIMYLGRGVGGTAHIVFDVTGYFQAGTGGATFHPLAPTRFLDSRIPLGATLLHSQTKQSLAVAGFHGIPADALAVTGNITITGQTMHGSVTVAPELVSRILPATSTINFPAGDIRGNGVTMPLSTGGSLDLMYWANGAATTNIVFDVTGYMANDDSEVADHAAATVIVASAGSPSDAVVAASAAAKAGTPFLLVDSSSLPAALAELLHCRPR
jgi:hypothetical protein